MHYKIMHYCLNFFYHVLIHVFVHLHHKPKFKKKKVKQVKSAKSPHKFVNRSQNKIKKKKFFKLS